MIPSKVFSIQKFQPHKLTPAIAITKGNSPLPFCLIPLPETHQPPITPQSLQDSVLSSQWHFIKHLSPNLTPSLISTVMPNLRSSPDLVLKFIDQVDPHSLNTECNCLAITIISRLPSPKSALQLMKRVISYGIATKKEIFNGLVVAREGLSVSSSIVFDLFVRAFCELKRADEAFECFCMMKGKGILPKIETCNDLLSLFLKLNRTQAAWVLYAEMFRLRINSTVYTFNIMINVLCKEGKMKKAKEFIVHMEGLGFKPNVVTYNTIIQVI